jgi:hypothetical protein
MVCFAKQEGFGLKKGVFSSFDYFLKVRYKKRHSEKSAFFLN